MSQTRQSPDPDQLLSLDKGIEALESSSEFQGAIEPLDGHHQNDHFALIYENKADQLDVIAPFMQSGLESGERCMFVVDELTEEQVASAIDRTEIDVDAAIESGALTFHSVEETYLRNGSFDPDEMIEFYAESVEDVTDEYDGLRIVAETTWLQRESTSVEQFMEYEAKINRLFDEKNSIALCLYDRTAFEPEVVRDIIRTHPHLIYDGTVCNNLYYTPPKEYFRENVVERDVERMLGTLVERTTAKTTLEERQRFQRKLYEVTSDNDRTFEEKVENVLELGCERFGLDQGYVTRHDPDEDLFENEYVVGPADQVLRMGIPDAQPQRGQFCREALQRDEPAGAPDVRDLGWDDDPVYCESGLRSYFGVKITDGTAPYGTLAFCDTEPRAEPFTEDDHTFLELMGQWVSHALEQRRREDQLAALNEMSRELMNAETQDEIASITATYAQESLGLPLSALLTYDQETGQLAPAAATPRAEEKLPTDAFCERTRSPAWRAFVKGETLVVDAETLQRPQEGLTQLAAIPLSQQGVFLVATTGSEFGDGELDFLETTTATIEAASTRADREQLLHEREASLEAQNNTLERLNRINTTIRNLDQALVQAGTRTEIEEAVCGQVAGVGPYELAWVGEKDVVTNEVVPRQTAGTGNGYLQEISISTGDEPTGRGPVGRCIREREPQVVNDTLGDSTFEPWRQATLDRGYHSVISLPLVYDDTMYGVLVIYADQPGVFDDLERAVLTEMADTIAYAINAVESKKALVSDEVTELEFTVDGEELDILQVSRETGCECTVETLVPRSDGTLQCLFSTCGVTEEAILEYESQLPVTELSLLSKQTEDDEPVCLFDATLNSEALPATVLEHGGQVDELHVTDQRATVTVELAGDADVREFVEMFRRKYPDSTLTAQRSRQQTRQTTREFRSTVMDDLTERQREVLRTAYFNGYFAEPRLQSAREIADTLDIAQPTFNSHIRVAHRKVCQHLFGETRQV